MINRRIAYGLGWFSIVLGLLQLVVPGRLGAAAGIGDRPMLLRVVGVRELLSGIGVLWQRRPAPGLWLRVVGDVIDLGLLARAALAGPRPGRARIALGAVLAVGVLDLLCARRLQQPGATAGSGDKEPEVQVVG